MTPAAPYTRPSAFLPLPPSPPPSPPALLQAEKIGDQVALAERQMEELVEQGTRLARHEALFGLPPTEHPALQPLARSFAPVAELWKVRGPSTCGELPSGHMHSSSRDNACTRYATF